MDSNPIPHAPNSENQSGSTTGKSHWQWIKRLLIFGIMFIFISSFISVIIMLIMGYAPEELYFKGASALLYQAIVSIFLIIYIFVHAKYFDKFKPETELSESKISQLKFTGVGLLLGILMFVFYLVLFIAFNKYQIIKNPNPDPGVIIQLLVVLFIMAFFEEVLYRYYILGIIKKYSNISMALIVSSVIFGITHLTNPNVLIVGIINIIGFGVFIGLVYIYFENLCSVTALHFIWNALTVFAGFNVSGLQIKGLPISIKYPDSFHWLSGGDFGPEGSILTTFLLILFSIYFMLRLKQKGTLYNG